MRVEAKSHDGSRGLVRVIWPGRSPHPEEAILSEQRQLVNRAEAERAPGHAAHGKRTTRGLGAAWVPRGFSLPILVPNHVTFLNRLHHHTCLSLRLPGCFFASGD